MCMAITAHSLRPLIPSRCRLSSDRKVQTFRPHVGVPQSHVRQTYLRASRTSREYSISAQLITPENFKPYGQVAHWEEDGKPFDEHDLHLRVCDGVPRLYIFRARARDLTFTEITYHEKVTQCLFGLSDHPWYLAVAKPTFSVTRFPTVHDIEVFQIEGHVLVRMDAGVWHAGPLFHGVEYMDFLNLELSDTNVRDHNTHSYRADGVQFSVRIAQK